MNTTPIMKKYELKAKPNKSGRGGFIGAYSIPGKDEQFARNEANEIEVFETEDEAVAAAGDDLCTAMNARTKYNTKQGYRRMGGAELAVALKELGITPAQLSAIYGTTMKRVLQWIDGDNDIPHVLNLLIAMLAVPGMKTLATSFTPVGSRRQGRARKGRLPRRRQEHGSDEADQRQGKGARARLSVPRR